MFDSCFSGSILNLRDRVVPQNISASVRYPVRQFITAGSANEPVPDHSIFKQAFLDLLERRDKEPIPDGYVTGEELGLYLKNKVPEYNPTQHPQYGKIRDIRLDKGDFIFQLAASSGAVVEEPARAAEGSMLSIQANISGARVLLDGNYIGPTATKGKTISNSLGMKFVYIPPGTFTMGSPEAAQLLGALRYARECVGVVPGLVRRLSIRFCDRSQRTVVRLVPCASGRLLGLQRQYLPFCVSQHVRSGLPEQVQRIPACPASRSVSLAISGVRKRMKQPEDAVAEQASQAVSIRWIVLRLRQFLNLYGAVLMFRQPIRAGINPAPTQWIGFAFVFPGRA